MDGVVTPEEKTKTLETTKRKMRLAQRLNCTERGGKSNPAFADITAQIARGA